MKKICWNTERKVHLQLIVLFACRAFMVKKIIKCIIVNIVLRCKWWRSFAQFYSQQLQYDHYPSNEWWKGGQRIQYMVK